MNQWIYTVAVYTATHIAIFTDFLQKVTLKPNQCSIGSRDHKLLLILYHYYGSLPKSCYITLQLHKTPKIRRKTNTYLYNI